MRDVFEKLMSKIGRRRVDHVPTESAEEKELRVNKLREKLKEKIGAQAWLLPVEGKDFKTKLEPGSTRDDAIKRIEERARKVDIFVENYDKICHEIFLVFQKLVKEYNVKVGSFKIIWVGGRMKDSSFRQDTDIDLIFCVDYGSVHLMGDENFMNLFRHEVIEIAKKNGLGLEDDTKIIFENRFLNEIWEYSFYLHVLEIRSKSEGISDPYIVLLDEKVN